MSIQVYHLRLMATVDCAQSVSLSVRLLCERVRACIRTFMTDIMFIIISLLPFYETLLLVASFLVARRPEVTGLFDVACRVVGTGFLGSDEEGDVGQRRKSVHDKLVNEILVELWSGLPGNR